MSHAPSYIMRSFSRKDKGMRGSPFPLDVEKLTFNLYNIVRDMAQTKGLENDPVMLACYWCAC